MTASCVDLTIEQGADFCQVLQINDPSITTQELTSASAIMQFRNQYGDPTAILTLSTSDGTLTIDAQNRTVTPSIGWMITSALLPVPGVHDIKVITTSGLHKRTHEGRYAVSPAVTLDDPSPISAFGQFDFSNPNNSALAA